MCASGEAICEGLVVCTCCNVDLGRGMGFGEAVH